jgi:hypothetical protein
VGHTYESKIVEVDCHQCLDGFIDPGVDTGIFIGLLEVGFNEELV